MYALYVDAGFKQNRCSFGSVLVNHLTNTFIAKESAVIKTEVQTPHMAELVGIYKSFQWAIKVQPKIKVLRIFCDNSSVINELMNLNSQNPKDLFVKQLSVSEWKKMQVIARKIKDLAKENNIKILFGWRSNKVDAVYSDWIQRCHNLATSKLKSYLRTHSELGKVLATVYN